MYYPYRIARPSQYLAITGAGIDDVKLEKKAWILPFQSCTVLDLTPANYIFDVGVMSNEKLPFVLPVVFTVGPPIDDHESLIKYAKLISPHGKNSDHVKEIVQGIIEGEACVLADSMTMEEVYRGTKEFIQQVLQQVQSKLNQFGLWIYNANVKQLMDTPGHEYFSYLGQKTPMEANQVNVVAEAKAKIDAKMTIIAMTKARDEEMRRSRAKTQVKLFEIGREAEVPEANFKLATKKTAWTKDTRVTELEATKTVTMREAELQVEAETMNAMTITEKLKVQNKNKEQELNWELYKKLVEAEVEAEAQKTLAEATLYARKQAAEAELYAKKKEAEGIVIIGNAINKIGKHYPDVRDYLIKNGARSQKIAKIKAEVYVKIAIGVGLIAVILAVLKKLMAPVSEAWAVVKR